MDEGKHMCWGEGHPDLLEFKKFDYTYPPDQYRPLRRAQKLRPSAYPIHELTSARLTLMRSLVNPNPNRKPGGKPSVNPARMKSLLGLPAVIPGVVLQHLDSGKSYLQLEPNKRPDSGLDRTHGEGDQPTTSRASLLVESYNTALEVITSPTGCDERSGFVDESDDNTNLRSTHGECSNGSDRNHGYITVPDDDSTTCTIVPDDSTTCTIVISSDESQERSTIESRLADLGLVPLLKCDYCEFSYQVSRDSDVRDRRVQADMRTHLVTQKHYCASSYFARNHGDGCTLTELYEPALIKNQDAYLETLLAMCPGCGFALETIHQAAVHYRYTHDMKLAKYDLTEVLERCEINDLFNKQCTICHAVFEEDQQLNYHCKTEEHWPFSFRDYNGDKLNHLVRCPLDTCHFIFRNLNGLKSHFQSAHSDVMVAPPVVVLSFHGARKNGTATKTFQIPVPDKGESVLERTAETISKQDKKLLKQVVTFFGHVKGYPSKPSEKAFLRHFKDKNVERSRKNKEDMALLHNKKGLAVRANKVSAAEKIGTKIKQRKKEEKEKLKRKQRKAEKLKRARLTSWADSEKIKGSKRVDNDGWQVVQPAYGEQGLQPADGWEGVQPTDSTHYYDQLTRSFVIENALLDTRPSRHDNRLDTSQSGGGRHDDNTPGGAAYRGRSPRGPRYGRKVINSSQSPRYGKTLRSGSRQEQY